MAQPHSIERNPAKPVPTQVTVSAEDVTKAARFTLISLSEHSLGRIALRYKHKGIVQAGPIAYAIAKECRYGPRFLAFDRFRQAFVVGHETCHHALGHIPTGAILYKRDPKGFSFKGFNIACDAVINYALARLPEPGKISQGIAHGVKQCQELGIVNWDDLCREMRKLAEGAGVPLSPVFETTPNKLTSTDIYIAMMQGVRRVAEQRRRKREAPDWGNQVAGILELVSMAKASPSHVFVELPIPLGPIDLHDALAALVRDYRGEKLPTDLAKGETADWSAIVDAVIDLATRAQADPLATFAGSPPRHSISLYNDLGRINSAFRPKDENDSSGSEDGDGEPGDGGGSREPDDVDSIIDRLADDLNAHDDLREAIEQAEAGVKEEDLMRQAHSAQSALRREQAGASPGDAIMQLSARLTLTRTPWRKLLKNIATSALVSRPQLNPLRPSRRTISAIFELTRTDRPRQPGASVTVMPRLQRNRRTRRCFFIIDTSGSMWGDRKLMADALNEVWTLCRLLHVDMTILFADVQVAETVAIGEAYDLIKTLEPKGGGGTDFRHAIAQAEAAKPDLIIYYTDLCGTFPERAPRTPIIWAYPPSSADIETPFGKRLEIVD